MLGNKTGFPRSLLTKINPLLYTIWKDGYVQLSCKTLYNYFGAGSLQCVKEAFADILRYIVSSADTLFWVIPAKTYFKYTFPCIILSGFLFPSSSSLGWQRVGFSLFLLGINTVDLCSLELIPVAPMLSTESWRLFVFSQERKQASHRQSWCMFTLYKEGGKGDSVHFHVDDSKVTNNNFSFPAVRSENKSSLAELQILLKKQLCIQAPRINVSHWQSNLFGDFYFF